MGDGVSALKGLLAVWLLEPFAWVTGTHTCKVL